MKFILIVAFMTSNVGGGAQGISMQEFESKPACELAGGTALKLAEKLRGGKDSPPVWECVPK
ncbi:hypothetical protein G3O06_05220 [Burkholderia sp. Ac-20345]|uniref:hypothetical protein n=1 Tax=Burkholderia sp. Ac-20345 TaxID=2703891 RepID=UPI00197B57B2|nr:hypothetical protein [Burkholderia sp. Ac-20345]MBN3776969.1 hypothetical protein [Burkholderia sp. Ac-20345]